MNFKELAKPFPEKDIEWRIGRVGTKNGKPWAMVLAYLTNRAIMDRLDSVVGPDNWCNEFTQGPQGGVLCGISIKVGDEWVTKWDGADNTAIEKVKGGLSDSMKRAAVQWGIGRYLYSLDEGFAKIYDADSNTKGLRYQKAGDGCPAFKWAPPKLEAWALPPGDTPSEPPKQDTKASPPKQEKKASPVTSAFEVEAKKLYERHLKAGNTAGITEDDVNGDVGEILKRYGAKKIPQIKNEEREEFLSEYQQIVVQVEKMAAREGE